MFGEVIGKRCIYWDILACFVTFLSYIMMITTGFLEEEFSWVLTNWRFHVFYHLQISLRIIFCSWQYFVNLAWKEV